MEMPILSFLKQLWQELEFTPSLVFLFFLSLLVLFILRRSRSKLNLPPSPLRLPLIGNLHQLGTHPHRSFRALSEKYGPLMLLHLGQNRTLVVSSADMVKEIVKNHDIAISNRPKSTAADMLLYKCQDIGFAPYSEYWRQARKICVLELLSLKRVQEFQLVREEVASALIESIRRRASQSRKDSSINLSEMLLAASNNILSRCVLGRSFGIEDGRSRFGVLARKLTVNMMAFSVGDYFPSLRWIDNLTGLTGRFKELFRELDSYVDEVVEEHKEAGSDVLSGSTTKDLLDILLGVQKHGMLDIELTPDDMKGILMDMFVSGSDTTSTALEWAMTELLRHPETGSLAACELLYNAGYRNLFWVQGGLEDAEEEDLVIEGPQPIKFASIGGVSEFLGWTDQQRVQAAKEGWGYRLLYSARLVGVFLVADALFLSAQRVGSYIQDLRSR